MSGVVELEPDDYVLSGPAMSVSDPMQKFGGCQLSADSVEKLPLALGVTV
jgi:hypothetical protein